MYDKAVIKFTSQKVFRLVITGISVYDKSVIKKLKCFLKKDFVIILVNQKLTSTDMTAVSVYDKLNKEAKFSFQNINF